MRGEFANRRVGRFCGRVSSPGNQKSLERSLLKVRLCHSSRETWPLKSRDQVVGQPNYFPIEGVGRESTSGNLPERIVLTQLSDAWLHSGAAVVELPHPGRRQRQVVVPGSIRVPFP